MSDEVRSNRLPANRYRSCRIGFDVTRAENGAWVLSEVSEYESVAKHFVCADADALYDQMRAWVEREIVQHRGCAQALERTESGAHLTAARDVSA